MVKLNSSRLFISDTPDVWGNEVTIGLSELAVRTKAPPLVFDRRGDILRWADFESATPNYELTTLGTATARRSTDVAANGDFSLKCYVDGGGSASLYLFTMDFHIGRIGASVLFSSPQWEYAITANIIYYSGSKKYHAAVKYDMLANKLYYLNSSGTWTEITTSFSINSIFSFSTIKVVANMQTRKYERAICFGEEFDLTTIDIHESADASTKHITSSIDVVAGATGTANVYVDNIIMTQNEPENA